MQPFCIYANFIFKAVFMRLQGIIPFLLIHISKTSKNQSYAIHLIRIFALKNRIILLC